MTTVTDDMVERIAVALMDHPDMAERLGRLLRTEVDR